MINRRQLMQLGTGALAFQALPGSAGDAQSPALTDLPLIQRPIPGTGEMLPVIGMGTSRTFDAPEDEASLANLSAVMRAFTAGKGTVIDSSPMYGNAESRVGDVLRSMSPRPPVFAATKVWTNGREAGIEQMAESARRMGVERFDLIAVHNLKDWKVHLDTLRGWKADGKVRYIGVTTSHGRMHDELLEVMRTQALDFVQFSYNLEDRFCEQQLLPLAQDKGIATMINRPFQAGKLFKMTKGKKLPEFAKELDIHSWGQFFLKFIIAHPAVTCVIPATAKAKHMRDNMGANFGKVPELGHRVMMVRQLYRGFK